MSRSNDLIQRHGHSIAFANDNYDIDYKNNPKKYEPLYEIVNSYLSLGYAVIYSVESFQNNGKEEKDLISNRILKSKKAHLKNKENDEDHNYIKSNINKEDSLIIIDARLSYNQKYDDKNIVNYWFSQFSKIEKKFNDKEINGIFGISSPDPYFTKNKYETFISFEKEIGKKIADNLAILCWYKKKWLEKLELPNLLNVLISHENVLHNNFQYDKWNKEKIFKIIRNIIDTEAGTLNGSNEASTLLFETIRHVYKINKESLISNPQNLEDILSKILGTDYYYNTLQPSILNEIKKEVLFKNDSNLPSLSSI